jgi:aspartyl-tRNA(Asn)/glutamyl-tRNA(Gln) amidotransferase subunit A
VTSPRTGAGTSAKVEASWPGVGEIRARIAAGSLSALEVTEEALARASSVGERLHAFTSLDPEGARKTARELDKALARGVPPGPLHGVPLGIKDLISTRGIPTTGGSRALKGVEWSGGSRGEATVVRRLRRAGAVVLGKTNLNEFAYGVTGENAHFGNSVNPWAPDRMSGGSSGGSAVAVAAGILPGAVGTDTRGSIRIPAACCGITGFKPTLGRVPTRGVFPLSRTLDHVGPLARSVEEVSLLFFLMAGGPDPLGRHARSLQRPVEGLRLGLPAFFRGGLDAEVARAFDDALEVLEGAGLELVEIQVPELEGSLEASAVIAGAEALAVHDERLKEGPEDFDPAVRARLVKGYSLTGLALARAQEHREALSRAYLRAFRGVDLMAGPTLPGLPPRTGGTTVSVAGGGEEWVVDAFCRFMAPQNMTGAPALSLPCGLSSSGIPIGLQLWAAPGADPLPLAVGRVYQERTEWHRARPPTLSDAMAPGRAS